MHNENGYGNGYGERREAVFICTEYRTGAMTGAWADDPDKAHLTRPPAVSTGAFPLMPAQSKSDSGSAYPVNHVIVCICIWLFPFQRRGDRVIVVPLTLRRDVRQLKLSQPVAGVVLPPPSIF